MSQQYGIKVPSLDAAHPGVVLYGVTPDNQLIPVKVDANGVLSSSAILEGSVSLGSIFIQDSVNGRKVNVIFDGANNALVVAATSLPLPQNASTEPTLQSVLTSLLSLSSNLINGDQKTQIVDSIGQTISSSGGALDVNVVSGGFSVIGTELTKYQEVLDVPTGIATTVVSYTVPSLNTLFLDHVSSSGDNVAQFKVQVAGNTVATKRSHFTNFNVEFDFDTGMDQGLLLSGGSILEVSVLHSRPAVGNFNTSLFGRLI